MNDDLMVVDWAALEAQWTTLSNSEEFVAPLFQRVMLQSYRALSTDQKALWIPREALGMLFEAAAYAENTMMTGADATASRYATLLLLDAVRKGFLPIDGILSGNFDCDGSSKVCSYDVHTGDLSQLKELVIILHSFDL